MYRIHAPNGAVHETDDPGVADFMAGLGHRVEELAANGTVTCQADPRYVEQQERDRAELEALDDEERADRRAARPTLSAVPENPFASPRTGPLAWPKYAGPKPGDLPNAEPPVVRRGPDAAREAREAVRAAALERGAAYARGGRR